VYDEAGASATFQIYEGVGHEITRSIYQDITAFHRRTSDAQHAQFELTLQRSADQIAVGTPITVTVQARNRMSEQGTIEPTFFIDETDMETVERNVAPNESIKLTFEHTFDEPGSYSLYIDGRQVGDRPVTVIEPTATPEPTATESAAINQSPATDSSVATEASGPGFEVSTALAGVAGLSYLLRVRKDD
jgi:PGF-CTERM protein